VLGNEKKLLSLSMQPDWSQLWGGLEVLKKSAQFFATLLFEVAVELSSL